MQNTEQKATSTSEQYADIVIVGAGFSGLSALVVANKYLSDGEYALIADVRSSFGGHWHDVYSYVRLHQPYQLYTTYDKKWNLKSDPWYLAKGHEVVNHFLSIGAREVSEHATKMLFGHRYIQHDVQKNQLYVTFESIHDNNKRVVVRTKRLVNAYTTSTPDVGPMQLSSAKVTSITPNMLPDTVAKLINEKGNGRKYHFVTIGSGKSGMDTVKYLYESIPKPQVVQSMVAGKGMAFMTREEVTPKKWQSRIFHGQTMIDLFVDIAMAWNGSNEEELMQDMLSKGQLLSSVKDPYACSFGLASHEEMDIVKEALGENIIKGRIADIIDVSDVPSLVMEDGRIVGIPGIDEKTVGDIDEVFVVNCATKLVDDRAPRPLLSDNDMVLSPQISLLLPGPSSAMMTHLWFCGKLKEIQHRLYRVHMYIPGTKKGQVLFKGALATAHNTAVVSEVLPYEVVLKDRTNPLKWFPLHRQLMTTLRLRWLKDKLSLKCDELLGCDAKYVSFGVCHSENA